MNVSVVSAGCVAAVVPEQQQALQGGERAHQCPAAAGAIQGTPVWACDVLKENQAPTQLQ